MSRSSFANPSRGSDTVDARRKKHIFPRIIAISVLVITVIFASAKLLDYIIHRLYPIGYSDIVSKYSAEYSVPEDLIYAVIKTESSFRADVRSHAGACGLMQITPDTFEWLMTKTGDTLEPDSVFNPDINIKYGTFFLAYLYREFGKWETVYAAYNAGMNRVAGWLEDQNYSDGENLTYIPIKETREYVEKVAHAREMYVKLYFNEK